MDNLVPSQTAAGLGETNLYESGKCSVNFGFAVSTILRGYRLQISLEQHCEINGPGPGLSIHV
jgi:hypothetical protein